MPPYTTGVDAQEVGIDAYRWCGDNRRIGLRRHSKTNVSQIRYTVLSCCFDAYALDTSSSGVSIMVVPSSLGDLIAIWSRLKSSIASYLTGRRPISLTE